MKTITTDEFIELESYCGEERARGLAGDKERWSAVEILALEEIPAVGRFRIVLREELMPAPVLHEFMCRCAERALALVKEPDPRSVAAIETARRWMRGEATDAELEAAEKAAWAAAGAAWAAAGDAAGDAARSAAWAAEGAAAWNAAPPTTPAECRAAYAAEREAQAAALTEMLLEEEALNAQEGQK
jgi:hypothetical protein